MNSMIEYSVIIPVYNAEKTIGRCLDSLLNNIPKTAELLVINDGSKDKSSEVCKAYADKYSEIHFFEKENGGVSSARNLGLDNAQGEYILFADSDDYVVPDYWSTIESIITSNTPDLLQFGFQDRGNTIIDRNTGDYNIDELDEVAEKINEAIRKYMFSALYSRAFRNDIIQKHHLRFENDLTIGEDQVFIFAYAMNVKSMVSISKTLYVAVLENQESLTRKKRDYLVEQLRVVNKRMFDLVEHSQLPEKIQRIYISAVTWVYYRSVYSCCKELLKYNLPTKSRKKKIKEICAIYSSDNIRPIGLKCFAIALPVKYRMSLVIDVLINRL